MAAPTLAPIDRSVVLTANGRAIAAPILDASPLREGFRGDDDELVPADACDEVVLPGQTSQAAGDGDQESVPDGLAVPVVDRLEVVEVEAEHRRPAAAGPDPSQAVGRHRRQAGPVDRDSCVRRARRSTDAPAIRLEPSTREAIETPVHRPPDPGSDRVPCRSSVRRDAACVR